MTTYKPYGEGQLVMAMKVSDPSIESMTIL